MTDLLIKRLLNEFRPDEPLSANHPNYVDCDAERHSDDIRKRMGRAIRNTEGPVRLLISGHRGCGKTTELQRLATELKTNVPLVGAEHVVVFCETEKYLSLDGEVEYVEVLFAIMQALCEVAFEEKDAGAIEKVRDWSQLKLLKLRTLYDEFKELLSLGVEFQNVTVDAGLVKLVSKIRGNASNRSLVREHLRRKTTLVEAVNEVIQAVQEKLAPPGAQGFRKIVVIVDNLDRIPRVPLPNGATSHDAVFLQGVEAFKALECHVIFTIPPALFHSPRGAGLQSLYASAIPPHFVPMIPMKSRFGAPNSSGAAKVCEIVERRLRSSGVQGNAEVFENQETLDLLCEASGGFPRQLANLMCSALNYAEKLPLTQREVSRAIAGDRDLLALAVASGAQWEALRTVRKTKERPDANEECLQLLEKLLILQYRDERGYWYDVNPLLWNHSSLSDK
jgi:hypothetical protein